jgi:protein tyrosine phosphatase (PTP) superfamily phosphohydrolase (DUF442 family)
MMDLPRIDFLIARLVALALSVFGLSANAADAGLENYHTLSPRISSSGEPVGDAAFAALAQSGVKTIVSVDGAKPDVAAARRHGLRYIHLPIGYDGVPAPRIAAIAQLLRDQKERVHIHCHHGKHRGPAVAVIACMIEGSMTKKQALESLQTAGTNPDYAGLWKDVRAFSGVPPVAAARLAEVSEVSPLATAMVSVDHAFEKLSARKSDKDGAANSPGLAQLTEPGVLLVEGFREAARNTPESADGAAELRTQLNESRLRAERLLEAIRGGDTPRFDESLATLKNDCRACHRKFRD